MSKRWTNTYPPPNTDIDLTRMTGTNRQTTDHVNRRRIAKRRRQRFMAWLRGLR